MSRSQRAVKMDSHVNNKNEPVVSTEVAEAIKALQVQLADLRKIVQAAKSTGAEPDLKSGNHQ